MPECLPVVETQNTNTSCLNVLINQHPTLRCTRAKVACTLLFTCITLQKQVVGPACQSLLGKTSIMCDLNLAS